MMFKFLRNRMIKMVLVSLDDWNKKQALKPGELFEEGQFGFKKLIEIPSMLYRPVTVYLGPGDNKYALITSDNRIGLVGLIDQEGVAKTLAKDVTMTPLVFNIIMAHNLGEDCAQFVPSWKKLWELFGQFAFVVKDAQQNGNLYVKDSQL